MNFDLLFLILIITLAYSVGSMTGFGSAIIAITFAVYLFPIDFLIPIIVILNLCVTGYLAYKYRTFIDYRILLKKIIPFTLLGMPIGLILFNTIQTDKLKWAFGLFVFILAIFEFVRTIRSKKINELRPISAAGTILWLFSGGIIQGLWVSAGPVIAYWAGRTINEKAVFRSTLCALWVFLNTILLISHLIAGNYTLEIVKFSLYLFPFMIVGLVVGEWLNPRLSERQFRTAVYSVLIFAGGSIVLRGM